MIPLEQDFPETAAAIGSAATSDPKLQEALRDYEHACERLENDQTTSEERAHWAEIRSELVAEIKRIFLRLGK